MALAAAVLLLAAGQYRTEGARGNEWSEPLEMMAHTLAQHGASLGRWVVYTREYAHDIQNDADFFKKMAEFKQTYRSFHWTFHQTSHWQKVIGTNEHSFFREQIQLVMTVTNGTPQTYILYEATGPTWSQAGWKEAAQHITKNDERTICESLYYFLLVLKASSVVIWKVVCSIKLLNCFAIFKRRLSSGCGKSHSFPCLHILGSGRTFSQPPIISRSTCNSP